MKVTDNEETVVVSSETFELLKQLLRDQYFDKLLTEAEQDEGNPEEWLSSEEFWREADKLSWK
ncbi:hypothetical protein FACS1894202_05560 [Clostridia bacterium]|nr:hypothetical protein FACS1894202_05560 [Clostridia bacterium]